MWLSFKNGVKGKVPEIKQALANTNCARWNNTIKGG
jgi:hypothetical protein